MEAGVELARVRESARLRARLGPRPFCQRDAAQKLRGAAVETHARPLAQRARLGQQVEPGIEQPRRLERAAIGQRVSPRNVRHVDAAQVDRDPPTGLRRRLRPAVHLQASDPGVALLRQHHQLLLGLQTPRHQRARDDGAKPLHREHAIDREPDGSVSAAHRHRRRHRHERRLQHLQPVSCARRHRDNGDVGEKRPRHELVDLQARELQRLAIAQVALRDDDEPRGYMQQPADVKVFARLRHHRLVRRDDEHHEVDAADAGEHVLDEPLVARHVDEREVHVRLCISFGGPSRLEVGEAKVDRDAALLLFLEAVRIGAGEGADEGALAVVDVACGADDDRAHGRQRRLRAARSLFPGRCLPAVLFGARVALARSCRGWALLRRGPLFSSDSRTALRISTSPRSTCRRSMSTLTTCTFTRSPSR